MVHVADTCMIAQGMDGLSRGSLLEGVLARKDMLSFVNLSITAIQQYPKVVDFVQAWLEPAVVKGKVLKREDWFIERDTESLEVTRTLTEYGPHCKLRTE
jgi:hypothetical protein